MGYSWVVGIWGQLDKKLYLYGPSPQITTTITPTAKHSQQPTEWWSPGCGPAQVQPAAPSDHTTHSDSLYQPLPFLWPHLTQIPASSIRGWRRKASVPTQLREITKHRLYSYPVATSNHWHRHARKHSSWPHPTRGDCRSQLVAPPDSSTQPATLPDLGAHPTAPFNHETQPAVIPLTSEHE